MLDVLKNYYTKQIVRFFEKNRSAKVVTLLGFSLALTVLITLVYQSFFYGFKYIARDVYFGEAVTLYVIELFLLVSFLLVFVSALMSGVFAFFRRSGNGADDTMLMASPQYGFKMPLALLRIALSSLWPLLVIIIPALIALRHVFGFPLFGFGLAIIGTVLLILLGSMLAALLLLATAYFHLRAGIFSLKKVVTITLMIFVIFLISLWSRFASVDLVAFFQAKLLTTDVSPLTPILKQFHVFPSHLSALVIYYGSRFDMRLAILSLLCLGGLLLLAVFLIFILQKHYLIFWQKAQEGSGESKKGISHNFVLAHYMSTARNATDAILRKEIITFFRNARGMWWVAFILFIWGIQSGSSHMLIRGLGSERVLSGNPGNLVAMLQFGIILYFIAMFVLRFAFPSFSAERKTTWVVASSPSELKEVFVSKLIFFVSLFSAFAALFTLANAYVLELALPLGVPMIFAAILGTFFLTTYGLALGAIFPSSETDDPERLSTTLPGLAFIFGALFYGAFSAFALEKYFTANDLSFFLGFIFLSIIGTLALVLVSHRSLERIAVIS